MVGAYLCGLLTGLLLPGAWWFYRRMRASQGVDGVQPSPPAVRGVVRNPQPATAPSEEHPVINRISMRSIPSRRRVNRTGR
jgi:hypothetical protein